jgi:transketolase
VLKRRRYAIRISIAAISIFATCGGKPELILIASGSEVSLCIKAHEELLAEGISSRVVSMPSWDIFEHLSEAYQESVLLPEVTARIAVEQASTLGWERYVNRRFGRIIGMKTFGASAPLKESLRKFQFEPECVTEVAKELLSKNQN